MTEHHHSADMLHAKEAAGRARLKRLKPLLAVAIFILVMLAAGGAAAYFWLWTPGVRQSDVIARGVRIGGMDAGGLTPEAAANQLRQRAQDFQLTYALQDARARVKPDDAGTDGPVLRFYVDRAVAQAMNVGRGASAISALTSRVNAAAFGTSVDMPINLDRAALRTALEKEFHDDITPARDASFAVTVDDAARPSVTVLPGTEGAIIDYDAVMNETERRAAVFSQVPVVLPVRSGPPPLNATDIAPLTEAVATAVARAPLSLSVKDEGWTLSARTLADWIIAVPGDAGPVLALDRAKAEPYLVARGASIATEPKNATFEETDGKVTTFIPGVNGEALDVDASIAAIAKAVFDEPVLREDGTRVTTVLLPTKDVEPEVTTENSNPYGIKEIIGVGATNFSGSPKNRIHNVQVGAAAVQGTLVPAGEEFSMLKTLGKIDASTGYLQELVIKDNKTTPEYGGGLCQIGSTAFRAALDSGLLITARQNHSYRVPYYERDGDGNSIGPGKDATIYDPAPDFKFKNDTGHAILITTKITGTKLEFFFWGVRDGRVASQTTAKVFNIVQPPEKKVVETDTLKPGEEKCTEHAHVGSDAVFTYSVTYADGTKKDTDFRSHYKPWQEVCLEGIDPNAPKPPADPNAPAATPDGSVPTLDASGATGN